MIKKEYNTINDFLEDASFKNWALQNNGTDINFWEFWIENNPDKKELVHKAKDLVLGISFDKNYVSKEKVAFEWKKLEAKIEAKKITPKRKHYSHEKKSDCIHITLPFFSIICWYNLTA